MAIDLGLDGLSAPERKFLFDTLSRTKTHGDVAFSLERGEPGEMILTVRMRQNVVERSVHANLNG